MYKNGGMEALASVCIKRVETREGNLVDRNNNRVEKGGREKKNSREGSDKIVRKLKKLDSEVKYG